MSDRRVIHWFRRDLRLSDNTALNAALAVGHVVPVFIIDPALLRGDRFSPARFSFLLDGLVALDRDLRARGSGLVVRVGDPRAVLPELVEQTGAAAVFANRDYTPFAVRRDAQVAAALGCPLHLHDDLLLHSPGEIRTKEGRPYTVFTPFKRAWLALPKRVATTSGGCFADRDAIEGGPIPTPADLGVTVWPGRLPPAGEAAAQRRLEAFTRAAIYGYREQRNQLFADPFAEDAPPTSGLSPYLRFGMLSPRQAYAAAVESKNRTTRASDRDSADVWISELIWRDFYNHILAHFPHVLTRHFRPEYEVVPFRRGGDDLARWQAGTTGYPVVDAAMRQLAAIGWMHNRARMIVASFLTKHLLIHWKAGDDHFMRHLLDGDPAANNGGWQWAAGTGTDAQPYFRIFNPVSQSQQFDPTGAYIRHFVPELRAVPDRLIHTPWLMPTPPKDYPLPIVDHALARQRALEAFKALKPHQEANAS